MLKTRGNSTIPQLSGDGSGKEANLYSDLALHQMGALEDGISQGQAKGNEFRTAPLWGLGKRIFFLHDGRTSDLVQAIEEHRGYDADKNASEANTVVEKFNKLPETEKQEENRMPTYVCSAATGRLTPVQKTEIVRSITAIHHEETGAPRYLVQLIFHDVAPGNHYVAGRPAPADQIWIRADIRGGRTAEQKSQMLRRIMQDVGRAIGAAEDAVWIYLCDIPAANIAEYGRVLPPPGEEDAWFSLLPDAMRERLRPLA